MPGGILNGFKSFVERVVPKNLPIPGVGNSDEDEKKDVWDKDLHLYNREGFYYVLIIDSNINDLEREQEILEETGCNVATASTGGEGLDRVSKDKYDLIMIFMDLPRMDGEQTLKNLKASAVSKCRDSKIYAILAETDKKGDQYYLNLGFDGIIRKPTEKCVMEYIIMHETSKYMRLRLRKGHITASQAEILRYVLEGQQGVSGIRIYPASGSISFSCEKEHGKILYKLKRLQFHNVEMFARELDTRISTEELSRRKLSPEVKNRLRRKVLIETVADLLMPVPLQVGYHAYQLVTLRNL